MSKPRAVAFGAVVAALVLLSAEAAARLDDWLHGGTPFLDNPERNRALTVHDDQGIRGRPHGRFKRWRLNAYGFRAPEMTEVPEPGVTRVLLLGASETFGLYESAGKEYPAQLAAALKEDDNPNVEVVNAAMAGMTVKSMLPYWEKWASRFRPRVVLIYPSPMLYLDDEPPTGPAAAPDPAASGPVRFASRFYDRLRDTIRQSELARRLRVEWVIRSKTSGKPADWFFPDVPRDRLDQFRDDLAALVDAIRARGAEPVLLTHALRAASPPRPDDWQDLQDMRPFYPRASHRTLIAFEDSAAAVVKELGRDKGVPVIDVAGALNGHRAWFADLVHFTDDGAAEVARVLAAGLEPILRRLHAGGGR